MSTVRRKPKQRVIDMLLRWHAEATADRIAEAIMATVSGPGATCEDPVCPDKIRYDQGLQDAATARRVGRKP